MSLTKSDKIYIRTQIKKGVKEGIDILRILIEELSHKQDLLIEGHGMNAKKLEGHDVQINNHEKRIATLEDTSTLPKEIFKIVLGGDL